MPKEASLMDVYVFLEALNVEDYANNEDDYCKLFDYTAHAKTEREDNEHLP